MNVSRKASARDRVGASNPAIHSSHVGQVTPDMDRILPDREHSKAAAPLLVPLLAVRVSEQEHKARDLGWELDDGTARP